MNPLHHRSCDPAKPSRMRHARAQRAFASFVVALAVVACEDPPEGAHDAGVEKDAGLLDDTGAVPGPMDPSTLEPPWVEPDPASYGSGPGSDAGISDPTGPDPWWEGTATSWKSLDEWSPDCEAYYATDPAKAAPALEWSACPGNEPGCEWFVPEFPGAHSRKVWLQATERADSKIRYGVTYLFQAHEDAKAGFIAAFYSTTGAPALVVRGDLECTVGATVGETRACVRLIPYGQTISRFLCSDDLTFPPQQSLPFDVRPQGVYGRMSDDLLTFWLSGSYGVGTHDFASKASTVVRPSGDGVRGLAPPQVWREYFVATMDRPGQMYGAGLWSAKTGLVSIVEATFPEEILDFRTDGKSLIWLRGDDARSGQDEAVHDSGSLWTAPFTTNPATLVPKKIRDVSPAPLVATSAAANGYYAYPATLDSFHLYRLSDGARWTIPAPSGHERGSDEMTLTSEHLIYEIAIAGRSAGAVRQKLSEFVSRPPD